MSPDLATNCTGHCGVVREAKGDLELAAELDVTVHGVLGFQACKITRVGTDFLEAYTKVSGLPKPTGLQMMSPASWMVDKELQGLAFPPLGFSLWSRLCLLFLYSFLWEYLPCAILC